MEPLMHRALPAPRLVAMGNARPTRRAFGHAAGGGDVVESEARAIRDAARRVLAGDTLTSVVQDWNARGITTAGGGPWRVNSLSNLLLQDRLVAPPQIVAEETHARLVALHASRGKGPRRATRRYLLTGLLRCWRCGGGMRGMPRTKGADLYVCPGPAHGGCSGTAVTADHAEAAITDLVLDRLERPPTDSGAVDGRPALRDLAAHRRRLEDLGELWASGQIGREEWLSLRRKVGVRAEAAEAEVARLGRLTAVRVLLGSGPGTRCRWPAMSADDRRQIVHTLLDHVVVLAAEPPRQVFRPERLQPRWVD
jgi:site-specific DNA recombinase